MIQKACNWTRFSKSQITVNQWDIMNESEQEQYIKVNNIKVGFTHSIAETLERGFGDLSNNGFWEYTCKHISENLLKNWK